MLYIEDTLISLDIVENKFICNLSACKGACCVEGDFGAPLTKKEQEKLKHIYQDIKPYLLPDSIKVIEEKGIYEHFDEGSFIGTRLMENGACSLLTYEGGIAKCGIEKAYEEGVTDFKKPMSCHLYPIRVTKNEETGFEAWNYDEWEICSAACKLGEEHQVPIYQFLKDAIIRAKGEDFYNELDAAAEHVSED